VAPSACRGQARRRRGQEGQGPGPAADIVGQDAYTLPRVEETTTALKGAKFFSTLDIKEAFWSVPLDTAPRELTALRTPLGLFPYTRLAMGLKTASAVFCHFLDSIVGDLHWTVALTYIDDILIFTKMEEEHVRALDELLLRLDNANLTLKSSKTSIGTTSVQFLGHILDGNGASPDPAKVKAIVLPHAQDSKALGTALGSFGYYRRFIRGYAKRTHLLREKSARPWTTTKAGTVAWTTEEEAIL